MDLDSPSTKYHSMCGSEIDIVQHSAIKAFRSYRTWNAIGNSSDRIVHGLQWKELGEKRKWGSPMYLRKYCSPIVTLGLSWPPWPVMEDHAWEWESCSQVYRSARCHWHLWEEGMAMIWNFCEGVILNKYNECANSHCLMAITRWAVDGS